MKNKEEVIISYKADLKNIDEATKKLKQLKQLLIDIKKLGLTITVK